MHEGFEYDCWPELGSVRAYRVWLCCDGSIDGAIALDDGSIVLCRLNCWFESEGWFVCWWKRSDQDLLDGGYEP